MLWSSFLTYMTVLAAVPFFYFLISIASRLPFVKSKVPVIKSTIISIVPAYSDLLLKYFDLFLSNIARLQFVNLAVFSLSVLSLLGAFLAFANEVYPERKKGIVSLVIFICFALILTVLAISVMVISKIVLPYLLPDIAGALYVRFFPVLVWFIVILLIFSLVKDRKTPFGYVAFSSLFTTMLIFILRFLLGIYFDLFRYSKIYGALAIVPTILLWLFLFWNVVLSGVILSKIIVKMKLNREGPKD